MWLGEADEHSDIAIDFITSEGGYGSMENSMSFVARDDREAEIPRQFEYFENRLEPGNNKTLDSINHLQKA